MLDGRIDTQGTVKNLSASGILDDIAHAEADEVNLAVKGIEGEEVVDAEIDAQVNGNSIADAKQKKNPRKLVEEEHRATGSVKWPIYNTYLKASCVHLFNDYHEVLNTHDCVALKALTGHGLSCSSLSCSVNSSASARRCGSRYVLRCLYAALF